MTTNTGIDLAQAREVLAAIVAAGAEMETRTVDESVAFLGPLARDTALIEPDPDRGWHELHLRPLYGTEGIDENGVPQFNDNSHLERMLVIHRFDLLDGGNLGMAHAQKFEDGPFGTYSVIRPVQDVDRQRLIDLWDAFVAGVPVASRNN